MERHRELRISVFISLFLALVLSMAGCERSPQNRVPFRYTYRSPNEVDIVLNGVTYRLNRYAKRTDTPFQYQFEPDGDVDITINGLTYDIDSPYDRDKDGKSVIKVLKKDTKEGVKKTGTSVKKKSSTSTKKSSSKSKRR